MIHLLFRSKPFFLVRKSYVQQYTVYTVCKINTMWLCCLMWPYPAIDLQTLL